MEGGHGGKPTESKQRVSPVEPFFGSFLWRSKEMNIKSIF